ncbi:serine/threonine-protein kinase [Streptomyces sp. NPDC097619]|uniref:serine/threonine-protein kinase n=1 Tax=Streptomyces sp. NPDC097619 TaxID=3157228 RepID=UPI0033224ACC
MTEEKPTTSSEPLSETVPVAEGAVVDGGTAVTRGVPGAATEGGVRKVAGRYRLLSELGAGGMGTVWRALDESLGREVAVKEVRAPAGLRAEDVARMYGRLEREAWAAARIPDRNVVTVHDVVMEDGRPWIVMELVRGESLADLLRASGPLAPRRAAHIGAEVLCALRSAHAAGVEHRDVKPGNVLLAEDGRVVLGDFGIATVEGSTALTMTGEVVGSPEYLPPERALGRPSGPESDLWSLGVMLYAAVEGVSPFRRDTALGTLRAVVDEEPPVPVRAGPLAPVIAGLLRKEPGGRTRAGDVLSALREIAHEPDATTAAASVLPARGAGEGTQEGEGEAAVTEPGPVATGPGDATTRASVGPAAEVEAARSATAATTTAATAVGAVAEPGTGAVVAGGQGSRRRRYAVLAAVVAAGLLVAGYVLVRTTGDGTGGDELSGSGVRVSVVGANTRYTGPCPIPEGQAPSFTATFTAPEPTLISYRWVSGDGSIVDPRWRTLAIGDEDSPSRQDTVRLTTWAKAGTLTTGMAVELQSPVRALSDPVPFSLTCTGG